MQDIQSILDSNDIKACQAKLARYDQWWAENKPIHDAVMNENADLKAKLDFEERNFTFGVAVGIGAVVTLVIIASVYRKRFVPKTARGKQFAVLVPASLWACFCFLGIASDSGTINHPISAAITAMFWISPSLIFGAIGFWWFSGKGSQLHQSEETAGTEVARS